MNSVLQGNLNDLSNGDMDLPRLKKKITMHLLHVVEEEGRACANAAKVICEMHGLMAPKEHKIEMRDAAEEIGVSRRELERVLGIAKGERGHNGN